MIISELLEKYRVKKDQTVEIRGKHWTGQAQALYSDDWFKHLNLKVKSFEFKNRELIIYV